MLPVVIIGADATVREAFQAWADDGVQVLTYETAEDATYALTDRLTAGDTLVEQAADGQWECTVVYADKAFGPALCGKPERLAHTGWTIVAGAGIDRNPERPRRVVDGQAAPVATSTIVWQAAVVLQASLVVDVATAGGLSDVRHLLEERPTP